MPPTARKHGVGTSSISSKLAPLRNASARIIFVRKEGGLSKEELITMEGAIDEVLPDGRFGVTLDNEHRIICYTAGKMRRYRIRSVVGDRVHVEMTPYDLTKGRITFRFK